MIEIPPEVMAEALAAARRESELILTVGAVGAAGQVVADWLDERYALTDDRHLVKVDDNGWVVQHPQSCRPNLFTCKWSEAGREIDFYVVDPGVYVGVEGREDGRVFMALGDRVDQ